MARNARFWTYWNEDWVKITLKPRQSLSVHQGGATDEGYFSMGETYTHEGDLVLVEGDRRESDCDGPHSSFYSSECILERLGAVVAEYHLEITGERLLTPDWKTAGAGQRDHYAEAMGY